MEENENNDQPIDAQMQRIDELTSDLQRTRADFENYRKRVEAEKTAARDMGQASAILKLLPVIDTIERAVSHIPDSLSGDKWAQGIAGVSKNLTRSLESLNLHKIKADEGDDFNPELHEAIQFDEDATGEKEVIAEELQPGYLLNGRAIRPAMVKVTRR